MPEKENELNLEDFKQSKRNLEQRLRVAIQGELNQFYRETSHVPSSINVCMVAVDRLGQERSYILGGVFVEVPI